MISLFIDLGFLPFFGQSLFKLSVEEICHMKRNTTMARRSDLEGNKSKYNNGMCQDGDFFFWKFYVKFFLRAVFIVMINKTTNRKKIILGNLCTLPYHLEEYVMHLL